MEKVGKQVILKSSSFRPRERFGFRVVGIWAYKLNIGDLGSDLSLDEADQYVALFGPPELRILKPEVTSLLNQVMQQTVGRRHQWTSVL